MNQSENNKIPYPGLFKDLLNRRVPQLVGFYLAGSWGVLQFFDWIVGRYLLSPLLVDMALTIIGALLPSIIILAYCHGSPGKNKWHSSEKIAIPINLILTFILVFSLFNHKNLDSIARRVKVTDESGKKIEKVVPKSGSIKELAVFDFKNLSGEKKLDWLKNGLVNLLTLDISQDPFVNIKSPSMYDPLDGFYIYRKFKDAGFKDTSEAPLMFQKKIAGEINSAYFLSGSIKKTENLIELNIIIYLTKNTKILSEKIFKGENIFSLVDELTVFVKKSLKLPSYENDEIVDLQIKDIYTDSKKAARLIELASIEVIRNNNWKDAQKYYEDAIKEDKTFALAYSGLAEIYAMNNKIDKWKDTYKYLMKYIYKLPDKMQFHIKAGYYLAIKGEPEKVLSILKMMIKLYPADLKSYLNLASRLDLTGNFDEAIIYYKKILKMSPDRFNLFKLIGRAYENKSDLKNALLYFKLYVEKFPKKPEGFLSTGKIEEKLGNFNEAGQYYEKALLLEPEKISTILLIAGLDIKTGRYKEALNKYQEVLSSVKEARKKASVYTALIDYYELKGQLGKALEYTELVFKEYEKYLPPLSIFIVKTVGVKIFLDNGKQQEIKKMLDSFKKKITSPFDKIVSLGYILYYSHIGELDKAESYIGDVKDFVKKTGTKQFLNAINKIKGNIFRLRGNYKQALVYYSKFLDSKPSNIKVLNITAVCYLKLKKFEKSTKYIKKVLKKSPFHPEFNYNASRIYFAMEKKELGLKHLKIALKGWEEADQAYIPAREAKELLIKYKVGEENGK